MTQMDNTLGDLLGTDAHFVVLVGRTPQKFTLRCDSFIPRSEFFQREREKARNKELRRYSDEPIIIANECPQAFADYTRFVYFGGVPDILGNAELPQQQSHFSRQISLYVLAERLGDFRTANRMSDAIFTHSRDFDILPEKDAINLAYRSTGPDSLLRALLRDIMVYERIDPHTDEHWYNVRLNEFHSEFRDDVLVELMSLVIESPDSTVDEAVGQEVLYKRIMDCELHHHDDNSEWNPKCLRSGSTNILIVVAERMHTFR